MFPRGSRRAALLWIHTPTENQAAITPHPRPDQMPSNPILPETHQRGQEDGPSWYFWDAPLGLDMVPGTSGGRKRAGREEKYRERQGPRARNPRSPIMRSTVPNERER